MESWQMQQVILNFRNSLLTFFCLVLCNTNVFLNNLWLRWGWSLWKWDFILWYSVVHTLLVQPQRVEACVLILSARAGYGCQQWHHYFSLVIINFYPSQDLSRLAKHIFVGLSISNEQILSYWQWVPLCIILLLGSCSQIAVCFLTGLLDLCHIPQLLHRCIFTVDTEL